MPSGLNSFVQNRHGAPLSASEMERRRNMAPSLKVKPTVGFNQPSQHTPLHDSGHASNAALTRTSLAHVQAPGGDVHKSKGLFEDSILSDDSDDTARDITT